MKYVSFLPIILLIACKSRLERQMETWNRRVAVFSSQSSTWKVVIPGGRGYVYPPGTKQWPHMHTPATLLLPDILLAEQLISIQLGNLEQHITYPSPPVRWKLHGYKRQYQGYWDEAGKLHVWVNAFWNNEHGDQGIVSMKDGGNYYWQVWVNVRDGRLYDLVVNGEA